MKVYHNDMRKNAEIINNFVTTGKISGTVTFSNVEKSANCGIMVALDKTDGLRTVAVAQSENARSAVDSAHAVVATNYPAFNYVNNYASTFGLTGNYATGWYMPTVALFSVVPALFTMPSLHPR